MTSITLQQVSRHFDGVPVLQSVDLEIHAGEFLVILGASGGGKVHSASVRRIIDRGIFF